jgi:hypothetical protein
VAGGRRGKDDRKQKCPLPASTEDSRIISLRFFWRPGPEGSSTCRDVSEEIEIKKLI